MSNKSPSENIDIDEFRASYYEYYEKKLTGNKEESKYHELLKEHTNLKLERARYNTWNKKLQKELQDKNVKIKELEEEIQQEKENNHDLVQEVNYLKQLKLEKDEKIWNYIGKIWKKK